MDRVKYETREQVLPVEVVDTCLECLKEIHPANWLDRSKHKPILSLKDGITESKYSCLGDTRVPWELKDIMNEYAPHLSGLEPNIFQVNRYFPGDFIPLHKDLDGYFAVVNFILSEGDECFVVYPDGKDTEGTVVPDKLGSVNIIHDIGLYHELLPVTKERYILTILYGLEEI